MEGTEVTQGPPAFMDEVDPLIENKREDLVENKEEDEGGVETFNAALFDAAGRLKIEKDVEPVLEAKIMLSYWQANEPLSQLTMGRNLFSYICCLVCDEAKVDSMSLFELYPILAAKFSDCMKTLLESSYFYDNFLSQSNVVFGPAEQKTWPQSFRDMVEQKLLKVPGSDWLKKNRKASSLNETMRKNYFFGSQILSKYRLIKAEITNRLNPHFIPTNKLKSGETPTAMLRAVRRMLWEPACLKTATANVQAAIYRKSVSTLKEGFNKRTAVDEMARSKMKEMTGEWFPDCWLAFILLSLPSEHPLAAFDTNSGCMSRPLKIAGAPSSSSKRRSLSNSPLESPDGSNVMLHKCAKVDEDKDERNGRKMEATVEIPNNCLPNSSSVATEESTSNSSKTTKRLDAIAWDDYFMALSFLSSMRSKDPNTQVGACIVSPDKRIVGIGYNGFPRGCSDEELPWARVAEDELDTKYPVRCLCSQ